MRSRGTIQEPPRRQWWGWRYSARFPGTDAAGGHKMDATERSWERLEHARATGGAGREELDGGRAKLQGSLDLGCGDGTREGEHAALKTSFRGGAAQLGRDHESRSGRYCLVHLRRRQNRACTDQDVATSDIARIESWAAAVRNVPSATGRPPLTRASAKAPASRRHRGQRRGRYVRRSALTGHPS